MKNVCMWLGYGVIVLGSLGSILMAYCLGTTVVNGRYGMELARSWPLTILSFLLSLFITAVLATILLSISEILEYLEPVYAAKKVNDVQSEEYVTKKASNVQSKEPALGRDLLDKLIAESPAEENFWKCPLCGKNNPPYTGTCSCGQSK